MSDEEEEETSTTHFTYKQELERNLTVTSIVGLGFSLMGVPFGLSSTLYIGLIDGGSVTLLWGWVLVTIFSLCVTLSLAEIVSKYPSSGGIYHFASVLAPEKYSLSSSWFTGWLLIIGNWTMFISITYGGSQFIMSVFGLKNEAYRRDSGITLLVYYIVVFVCGITNARFPFILEKINKLCIYWTIYTVLVMDILLILFASSYHDIKFILTHFNASRSGWPDGIAFLVGLTPGCFVLSGYGMLPSLCDETKTPEKTMPKGMVSAVLISGVTGIIFIIPILSILPELTLLLDRNPDIMPIDLVFKFATQSYLVSFLMVILLIGAVLFAGIGTLTTASRATYAMARDGALPYRELWSHVDPQRGIPINSLYLCIAISLVLGLLSLLSSSAFNAFVGSAVITLNVANGIPIFFLLLNKRRKLKGAPFKLHLMGYVVNVVSLAWILLTVLILCMPPQIPITVISMNYAFVVVIVFSLAIAIVYRFWGRYHFHGPVVEDEVEMQRLGEPRREQPTMEQPTTEEPTTEEPTAEQPRA